MQCSWLKNQLVNFFNMRISEVGLETVTLSYRNHHRNHQLTVESVKWNNQCTFTHSSEALSTYMEAFQLSLTWIYLFRVIAHDSTQAAKSHLRNDSEVTCTNSREICSFSLKASRFTGAKFGPAGRVWSESPGGWNLSGDSSSSQAPPTWHWSQVSVERRAILHPVQVPSSQMNDLMSSSPATKKQTIVQFRSCRAMDKQMFWQVSHREHLHRR
ncbi:hypothetical protein PR048_009412 [Dryococelus australis]|uniref:Uncharacterized protein n=1 Tax=Dryococelus australis TaxID=614101 RepID=A0ABQ9HZT5_9NEOP|nr:hypothetical protein PR048_009412 [Dryococelus australis]